MASSIRKEFDVAFRSALDAGESTFEFRGKKYNTKMAPPKTTSNRGGARMKSGKDVMDTLPKVGKVETRELAPLPDRPEVSGGSGDYMSKVSPKQKIGFKAEDMGMNQYKKPELSDFVPDFLTNKAAQNRETTLRDSLSSMADSDLTPKAGQRPTDEPSAFRKGGIVTAKRSSKRGCGIATKGFGRAGGR